MTTDLFKNFIYNICVYLIYVYKENLVLNNLQKLICHKTQPTNLYYNTKKQKVTFYLQPIFFS